MKKKIALVLALAVAMLSLVGCGSSAAKLSGSYAYGTMSEYSYAGTVMGNQYDVYSINLLDDGSYEMTYTNNVDMGGVIAGTTTMTTYGTYTKGSAADGYIDVVLKAPTRMIYNSYSTLGGFAFSYDTDTDTEFVIPGGDDTAISKADFLNQLGYGQDRTVYIVLDSNNQETCHIELTNE